MAETRLFTFGRRQLDLSRPLVMGILNVTPDSFSDGGELMVGEQSVLVDKALARGEAMVAAGAAILDVGGESTRPGARSISTEEEMDRILPVVEALVRELDVVISVDTSNPAIMAACPAMGVGLINDIRALSRDGALQAAAASGLPVCLMHMQGEPGTMQDHPHYQNVTAEVVGFLTQRVADCEAAGIDRQRIILDPGFGFGKNLDHNLQLLRQLHQLQSLGLPLLAGLSRKRMIGALTGKTVGDRVAGSVGAAIVAAIKGARILRVHDVEATVDALAVAWAGLEGWQG